MAVQWKATTSQLRVGQCDGCVTDVGQELIERHVMCAGHAQPRHVRLHARRHVPHHLLSTMRFDDGMINPMRAVMPPSLPLSSSCHSRGSLDHELT